MVLLNCSCFVSWLTRSFTRLVCWLKIESRWYLSIVSSVFRIVWMASCRIYMLHDRRHVITGSKAPAWRTCKAVDGVSQAMFAKIHIEAGIKFKTALSKNDFKRPRIPISSKSSVKHCYSELEQNRPRIISRLSWVLGSAFPIACKSTESRFVCLTMTFLNASLSEFESSLKSWSNVIDATSCSVLLLLSRASYTIS